MKTTISICIPSYNRPQELARLLDSIDSKYNENVEVLICEDKSPKRNEIKLVAESFRDKSNYRVVYHENELNLGYDNNIKNLVKRASNDFIIFMGDDDVFIPDALDKMISFLNENSNIGYVLKSHQHKFKSGNVEKFRYFNGNQFFSKGEDTYVKLFRRSVFISGFTINRRYVKDIIVDNFDGGLLYQLYLLAEVAMNYDCAYFDEPLTMAFEEGIPYFGTSDLEKDRYTPGTITVDNSLNFLKGFFDITRFIDNKYNVNSTILVKKDMSKYFYPSLAIQRDKGVKVFVNYVNKLNGMGFNCSIYYYIYVLALTIFGKRICDRLVSELKNIIGKTPQL
ncbi:glycosyltransferase family 2 protein [Vibrio fluvialis]|nr:glycosyltransferase family 2 protein [Vibrio fluvialis]EKO3506065.1 glycosyltransferase family 2 protein [Vibrio fluvialis]EKO5152192.1 glycosyltransferase family 2 protein [Vibrio fluvialis]ELO4022108.1 glycosyltransferase family 2 protein [Vibrio fluvialis]EMA2482262.1 glycosyltransferase family 2 protein [Vibrio fluvialis]